MDEGSSQKTVDLRSLRNIAGGLSVVFLGASFVFGQKKLRGVLQGVGLGLVSGSMIAEGQARKYEAKALTNE